MAFASSVLLFGAIEVTFDDIVVGMRSVCRSLVFDLVVVLSTLGAAGVLPRCRGGHNVVCWAPLEIAQMG